MIDKHMEYIAQMYIYIFPLCEDHPYKIKITKRIFKNEEGESRFI